jgi:hypothetical protein
MRKIQSLNQISNVIITLPRVIQSIQNYQTLNACISQCLRYFVTKLHILLDALSNCANVCNLGQKELRKMKKYQEFCLQITSFFLAGIMLNCIHYSPDNHSIRPYRLFLFTQWPRFHVSLFSLDKLTWRLFSDFSKLIYLLSLNAIKSLLNFDQIVREIRVNIQRENEAIG